MTAPALMLSPQFLLAQRFVHPWTRLLFGGCISVIRKGWKAKSDHPCFTKQPILQSATSCLARAAAFLHTRGGCPAGQHQRDLQHGQMDLG